MPRSPLLHRIGLLAGVSVLAGVVVAGLLLPVVGGVGLAARTGAHEFEKLPSELKVAPLPQRSRLLAADGSVLATFYYENRIVVPLAEVAPIMRKAIIAIEDSRFYEHHGIDLKGIARAALRNRAAGEVTQGGSTITQQYVKNALIESAPTQQDQKAAHATTVARKVREARYALALEQRLGKDDILERYLNIAYFGDGAYGIGSAAQHFFGVPASRLTLAQAATLAGLVKNPYAYDPHHHPKAGQARRDVVIRRMEQLGMVHGPQAAAALRTPLGLHVQPQQNGCEGSTAPYFCDYVVNDFLGNPAFGATRDDRVKLLLRGGLTIHTTLDPTVQRAAQKALTAQVPSRGPYGAAVAVVQPGTGRVLALATNKPYGSDTKKGQTRVNYAADYDHGGSRGFQSGSTFKVFVLAAALQQGIPLSTHINAPSELNDVGGFYDCAGGSHLYPHVGNADPAEAGSYDLTRGTWYSVNTFYVQLEKRTGLCAPAKLAEAMGVHRADGTHLAQYPSMVLGTNEVSPLDMAHGYATLAAHGKYCDEVSITRVADSEHKVTELPPAKCVQVLDPGVADTVTSVLRGVLEQPGATAAGHGIGRPAAGKTGTVEDFTAAWFCGYTPSLAAAVWVGFPEGGAGRSLTNVTINGHYYYHVYGGTLPASIWQETFQEALRGKPVEDFAAPDPAVARGHTVAVPDVRGLSPDEAVRTLRGVGLEPSVEPSRVPGGVPDGQVAYTDPGSGAEVYAGTRVLVFVSNGREPPPPPPVATQSPSASPTATPAQRTRSPAPKPSPTKKKRKP